MEIIYMTFIIDGEVEYLTENSNLKMRTFKNTKKKFLIYTSTKINKKSSISIVNLVSWKNKINYDALNDQSLKSLKSIRGVNDEMKYYAYSDSHKNIAYYKCWTKNCQGRAKGIIVENYKKLQIDGELKVLGKIYKY